MKIFDAKIKVRSFERWYIDNYNRVVIATDRVRTKSENAKFVELDYKSQRQLKQVAEKSLGKSQKFSKSHQKIIAVNTTKGMILLI